jgi:hypothetical protein
MKHMQTTQKARRFGWFRSIRRWLSHPTSEVLPPIFGDAVPPDLKVFEAQVEEAQHEIYEVPAPPGFHHRSSKPARRK